MTTETPVKPKSSFAGLRAAMHANSPKAPEPTLIAPPPARPAHVRKPKPLRRVGTVRDLSIFAGWRPGGFVLDSDGGINNPLPGRSVVVTGRARPWARGVEAMIGRLAAHGVRLATASNGVTVAVVTERGAMPPELREQIMAVWPLLAAFCAGKPLRCSWCGEEAVDLLLGGAPVCGMHGSEEVKP